MRYFLTLSYKGTNYNGWQIQRNAPSVQGKLEEALALLLRRPTPVTGAGRTDTGVHARYYVAHFDTTEAIRDRAGFCYHLNAVLPYDIAVHELLPVRADAHARFDATEREYRYLILTAKDPFARETAWLYHGALHIDAMNEAAAHLLAFDDFTTFAKLNSNNRTNICRISQAEWSLSRQGVLCFRIRADRFLRNMVRAVVGTLVDVGRGRYDVGEFRSIVGSRDLSRASGGAPAEGLYLWDVSYPAALFRRSEDAARLPLL